MQVVRVHSVLLACKGDPFCGKHVASVQLFIHVLQSHSQTPTFLQNDGSGEYGHIHSLGQRKEFDHTNQITVLSKSCDVLPQELGSISHSAGFVLAE